MHTRANIISALAVETPSSQRDSVEANVFMEKLGKSIYTVKELLAEAKKELQKKLRDKEK